MAYKNKKEMIAMLLAGGQGSRLGVLTSNVAKPAVPFGGKYRIIDFPLSNCTNSNIDTVGVLTQYQPLELNEYIGNGTPWDLDRIRGGISILPPYTTSKAGEWYQGTANAIYQNMHFIEMYNPEYVLILSGDHVYKMNYRMMLDFHKEQNADCTISVMEVPWEEAGRFGVMSTDEDMRIYEFEEKPKNPKSNLASMGVYIFTWSKLKEYLIMDEKNMESGKDFGKDVIPYILQKGQRLFAYQYLGYWKDVGTIDSLWEANMDLLDPNVPIDLDDPPWKIFSRNEPNPPQFIGSDAEIGNSMISEGSSIYGKVENSILFPGVVVEEGAQISSSILMDGAVVRKNAKVEFAILDVDVKIGENCHIGWAEKADEPGKRRDITVIGEAAEVLAGTVISAGELIDSRAAVGPGENTKK